MIIAIVFAFGGCASPQKTAESPVWEPSNSELRQAVLESFEMVDSEFDVDGVYLKVRPSHDGIEVTYQKSDNEYPVGPAFRLFRSKDGEWRFNFGSAKVMRRAEGPEGKKITPAIAAQYAYSIGLMHDYRPSNMIVYVRAIDKGYSVSFNCMPRYPNCFPPSYDIRSNGMTKSIELSSIF